MIPRAAITDWTRVAPWPVVDQVEQDLILARLIVEIANHPLLGDELVFRGGTCLHKLVLPEPLRYSEDLDYVRASHGPIGDLLDAIRDIAGRLGMDVNTDVSTFPKARLRGPFESGAGRMRVKIEVNTYETSPARPHRTVRFAVESPWWSGEADVLTFQPEELVATKLRALFQRRKGRDLFDLWLALTVLRLDPGEIVVCFAPYRPDGYTAERARAGLDEHLADPGFPSVVLPLLREVSEGYDIDAAGALGTRHAPRARLSALGRGVACHHFVIRTRENGPVRAGERRDAAALRSPGSPCCTRMRRYAATPAVTPPARVQVPPSDTSGIRRRHVVVGCAQGSRMARIVVSAIQSSSWSNVR